MISADGRWVIVFNREVTSASSVSTWRRSATSLVGQVIRELSRRRFTNAARTPSSGPSACRAARQTDDRTLVASGRGGR